VIVVGVGNAWRGDDAAGLAVARRLRELAPPGVDVREHEGEASGLVDTLTEADAVVVIDAASSRGRPGAVWRFDAAAAPLPARAVRSSTHAFGIPDAIELARSLGRIPRRLEVIAIEGADFTAGATLTPDVAQSVGEVAEALSSELG
jgi:hydrogenase maturation protease